jgi:hypothetical protein
MCVLASESRIRSSHPFQPPPTPEINCYTRHDSCTISRAHESSISRVIVHALVTGCCGETTRRKEIDGRKGTRNPPRVHGAPHIVLRDNPRFLHRFAWFFIMKRSTHLFDLPDVDATNWQRHARDCVASDRPTSAYYPLTH